MGMTGTAIWTFKTIESDGTIAYSSAMSRERAIEFICDLRIIGVRVVSLESSAGDALSEDEIARICYERRKSLA